MPEVTESEILEMCDEYRDRLRLTIGAVYIFDILTRQIQSGDLELSAVYPIDTLENAYDQACEEILMHMRELASTVTSVMHYYCKRQTKTTPPV